MNAPILDPHLSEELKVTLDRGLATGELLSPEQVAEHTGRFRDRFGPDALRGLDGEPLLRLLHGRQDSASRCLAYWLEFKNDDEFAGNRFGGIGGGSALKFGIFQRQSDNAWMTGSPQAQQVLSLEDAIAIARKQRDELLAGAEVLAFLDAADTSDGAYARLQAAMEKAAPKLAGDGWAHKYWFLINPDRLDDYHSPRYQRFHLFKLLQMPPDGIGILDGSAPRFICAGRFIAAARELGGPVTTVNRILNQRDARSIATGRLARRRGVPAKAIGLRCVTAGSCPSDGRSRFPTCRRRSARTGQQRRSEYGTGSFLGIRRTPAWRHGRPARS